MVPELFSSSQVHIVFPATNAVVDQRRRFFAEGPDDSQPFIYGDSSGYVGVAVRNGSAARTLGAHFGTPITFVKEEG
jgi:S-adenosylmethionine hydrolase